MTTVPPLRPTWLFAKTVSFAPQSERPSNERTQFVTDRAAPSPISSSVHTARVLIGRESKAVLDSADVSRFGVFPTYNAYEGVSIRSEQCKLASAVWYLVVHAINHEFGIGAPRTRTDRHVSSNVMYVWLCVTPTVKGHGFVQSSGKDRATSVSYLVIDESRC